MVNTDCFVEWNRGAVWVFFYIHVGLCSAISKQHFSRIPLLYLTKMYVGMFKEMKAF